MRTRPSVFKTRDLDNVEIKGTNGISHFAIHIMKTSSERIIAVTVGSIKCNLLKVSSYHLSTLLAIEYNDKENVKLTGTVIFKYNQQYALLITL